MTITGAKKVLERINDKAEKAFCEEYKVKPSEYHPDRNAFLVGYMQREFQNKTVLS